MPTWTLRPVADATVREDAPGSPRGHERRLAVASKVLLRAANQRLLCSFDLAGLPRQAARVVRAALVLAPERASAGRALRCHQATGPWDEGSVTWDTQPGVGADHGACPSDADPHGWDVTGSVQAAFPGGRAAFRVKDDAEGSWLARRQVYRAREDAAGPGAVLAVVFEARAAAGLASSVRPWVHGSAGLASVAMVRRRGHVSLASRLRLAFPRAASLACAAAVQGRGPGGGAPGAEAASLAREFLRFSEESGSLVAVTRHGRTWHVRRVVQLVDTHHTRSFPRAVTSEWAAPSTQDLLRRGDAVLYAAGADAFEPGDEVAWQGRPWVVVGSLGAEMVGDVPVYREVGLRRLAVTATARAQGVVRVASG